jgi:hypothetical protein
MQATPAMSAICAVFSNASSISPVDLIAQVIRERLRSEICRYDLVVTRKSLPRMMFLKRLDEEIANLGGHQPLRISRARATNALSDADALGGLAQAAAIRSKSFDRTYWTLDWRPVSLNCAAMRDSFPRLRIGRCVKE